jgi:hypothetical protein
MTLVFRLPAPVCPLSPDSVDNPILELLRNVSKPLISGRFLSITELMIPDGLFPDIAFAALSFGIMPPPATTVWRSN